MSLRHLHTTCMLIFSKWPCFAVVGPAACLDHACTHVSRRLACARPRLSASGSCSQAQRALDARNIELRRRLCHDRRVVDSGCRSFASQSGKGGASSGKGFYASASKLGIFGTAAFFGKRAMLVLGGKSVWGLFTIVSLKKFLFLPAWLWLVGLYGGATLYGGDKATSALTLGHPELAKGPLYHVHVPHEKLALCTPSFASSSSCRAVLLGTCSNTLAARTYHHHVPE
jgi:hypothetical protein